MESLPPAIEALARRREMPKETLERYLKLLELQLEDLRGKTILDIGCAYADFAQGVKEANIDATVVSMDRDDDSDKIPDGLEYVVADTQNIPLSNNRFDYVFSISALPGTAHMNLIVISGEKKSYQDYVFDRLSEDDKREYERQAKLLTEKATEECLRVTKEGGQIRLATDIIQPDNTTPQGQLDEIVNEAIIEVSRENAIIVKIPQPGEKRLFVIHKEHLKGKNETEILEPKTN